MSRKASVRGGDTALLFRRLLGIIRFVCLWRVAMSVASRLLYIKHPPRCHVIENLQNRLSKL